jgi:hypothetical protein
MIPNWILMFYSMPSKPERNRLRIYRRLQKAGTLSLKDGVHILPYSDDHYEFFQWLSQEIKTLEGEMQFVTIEKLEMMENTDLIALFQKQAEASYAAVEERMKSISINLNKEHETRQSLKKIIRDFDALYAIDFFHSHKGKTLQKVIQNTQNKLELALQSASITSQPIVPSQNSADYQGKQWQTRTKPFVDRMASAWLIRKFIDTHAEFIFANTIDPSNATIVTYDMNEATFTHIGDLCTFEVLLKSFNIEDTILNRIAQIIHNLDINDDKYSTPQADGIKLILAAIRAKTTNDHEILTKSSEIFDYLYSTL